MTRLFQLWLVLGVTLIVNLVAMIFVVLAGDGDGARDLSGAIGSSKGFASNVAVDANGFSVRRPRRWF